VPIDPDLRARAALSRLPSAISPALSNSQPDRRPVPGRLRRLGREANARLAADGVLREIDSLIAHSTATRSRDAYPLRGRAASLVSW